MARGLNVLALVTEAFGGFGGIAQYNRDFLHALADSAAVERIVALPRSAETNDGDRPEKIDQRSPLRGRLAYSANALARAYRDGPFDLVFCGHLYHAPLAVGVGRLIGARVWLQAHGFETWDAPSRLLRRSVDRVDLITTVSRYTRQRTLQWANLDPESVRVLPNTVRPRFSRGQRDAAVLEKFGLSGAKIVLTVSRIDKGDFYKGHDKVIAAIAEVRRAEPKAVYVIVGDGDGRDALEAHAAESGLLGDAVRFLGRLSDDDLLAFYRSSDVFIMPSTKEGFGIVFVEAAAAGLPVIAGDRDGSVDALADGALGRLIDPLSHEAIVAALVETLRGAPAPASVDVDRFAYAHFAGHVDALARMFAA